MQEVAAAIRSSSELAALVQAAFSSAPAGAEHAEGGLSRNGFAELLLKCRPDLKPQQLKKLFALVNTSGSGRVSPAEFGHFFEVDAEPRHGGPRSARAELQRCPTFGDGEAFQGFGSQQRGRRRAHAPPQPKGVAVGNAALGPLLPRIFSFVPPFAFLRAVAPAARCWSLAWYVRELRAVTVPDDQPSITGGVNACTGSEGGGEGGLVLVRPGVYKEAVRLVRSCWLLGLGPRDRVVIEAPGWESPLVFVQGQRVRVTNVTVRCRIQAARGKCVYIPAGQPTLERCRIEGGIHACGGGTAPLVRSCEVCGSPGHGLHFSDGGGGTVRDCVVEGNKVHGILADRGAGPEVRANRIINNGGAGIRLLLGSRDAKGAGARPLEPPASIAGNELTGNKGDGISLGAGFAEGEDEAGAAEDDDEPPTFDLFG